MIRKLGIALAAALSLGAAALAPAPASAHGWHGGWHGGWHRNWGGWGPGFYAAYPYYGYGGCWVRRLAPTPWGPRWRCY